MSTRGYGSKSDLEQEIEALETEVQDALSDLDMVRALIRDDALLSRHSATLSRNAYDQIMEILA